MTRTESEQIARAAEDLAELHPTHAIAGDLRAAAAVRRHAARKARDEVRLPMTLNSVEAAFARIFGEAR